MPVLVLSTGNRTLALHSYFRLSKENPMVRTQLLLLTLSVLTIASSVEAQWTVETLEGNRIAKAIGIQGQMLLGVSCQEGSPVVAIALRAIPAALDVNVEAKWDDGSIEHIAMREQNGILYKFTDSPSTRALVIKLRRRNAVQLRVNDARDGPVTETVDLAGSFHAIGALSCGWLSALSSRRTRHTDAEIKDVLIKQSISAYSGNCPCPYNRDRAGRRCGGRSAYSRPGGASPLCFPTDVGSTAVASYRRSIELRRSR